MSADLYDTLGVARNASADDIRRAYRKKAQKAHPDRGGDVAGFQVIQKAYDTLHDGERRARYDATGEDGHERDERGILLSALAMKILTAISTHDPDRVNPLRLVRDELIATKAGALEQRKRHDANISRMERATKRLRAKGEARHLHDIMAGAIVNERRAQANIDADAVRIYKLLALLEEYEYDTAGLGRSAPVPFAFGGPPSWRST